MSNSPSLHINKRAVTTPFGLLGTDENALTFALGYTFQQCPILLQWFLQQVGVPRVQLKSLRNARIDLQRYRSGKVGEGITDIEIHLPGQFHVIIEAKVGLGVPSVKQCCKYLPRFKKTNEPVQKLVALTQSPDESFGDSYADNVQALAGRFIAFNWLQLIPECIRLMMGETLEADAKAWVRSFYQFLDEEYRMKAFTTEVWILAISTKPLWKNGKSHWDLHQEYNVWWDFKANAVRPLYIAFRVDANLDSIYRVTKIEHGVPMIDVAPELKSVQEKWPLHPGTIWHFEPPVKLPNPIRTGGGMYNRRVRCDLDLLLTCKTVQEIEQEMGKRRDLEPA